MLRSYLDLEGMEQEPAEVQTPEEVRRRHADANRPRPSELQRSGRVMRRVVGLGRIAAERHVEALSENLMVNLPLPEADAATTGAVKDWLARFATCVREVDYASAQPFWHDAVVIFGTYQELVKGRQSWTDTQWDQVWPRTADFAFDLEDTMIQASPDGRMAVAIAPWTSTGYRRDGSPFARPGRATIVLLRQSDGRWVGVHSHMSLGRGVPQDSHGARPVKGR